MLSARIWRRIGFATLFSTLAWCIGVAAIVHLSESSSIFSIGAAISYFAFIGSGVFLLVVVPAVIGGFMQNSNSVLGFVNKAALAVALISVFMGVLFALAAIYGNTGYAKALMTCVVLFVGASCALCTIKFFYTNRDGE